MENRTRLEEVYYYDHALGCDVCGMTPYSRAYRKLYTEQPRSELWWPTQLPIDEAFYDLEHFQYVCSYECEQKFYNL